MKIELYYTFMDIMKINFKEIKFRLCTTKRVKIGINN